MDTDSLFFLPLYFIKENLNGWMILIFLSILIYFIILRNYYLKREQFYINTQDLENSTKQYQDDDEENIDDNNEGENSIQNSIEKNIDENEDEDDDEDEQVNTNTILEGFESPTTTNYATINNPDINITNTSNKNNSNTPSDANIDNINIMNSTIAKISTTLFDNIKLNSSQLSLCKNNYNQVINKYIIDILKLVKLKKSNEFLNTKKQFDVIIANGVDNIINYLANTIKSPLVLTRTSIKTDVLNRLSNTLEILIDNTNANLTKYINNLANMNSTTIDYKTMMTNVDASRAKIEEYIAIEKIIDSNGTNISNSRTEVNNILNKSNVLPIYEKNFDKINQLINSDFNSNETNLANKYGQAYTDFLNEKKKSELDINPLRLASKIESGIVNILSNLGSGNSYQKNKHKNYNDNGNDIIEQSNPIPEQNSKLVNNTNLNNGANIYNDRGNIGNYLIDKRTQKQVLEGFENETNPSTTSPSTTSPSTNSPSTTSYKKKNKKEKDLISNLLSGEFIQYIMDNVSEKLSTIYGLYDNKYGSGDSNNKDSKFNLEENMIPMGFMFFILSMLLFFVDTTS